MRKTFGSKFEKIVHQFLVTIFIDDCPQFSLIADRFAYFFVISATLTTVNPRHLGKKLSYFLTFGWKITGNLFLNVC